MLFKNIVHVGSFMHLCICVFGYICVYVFVYFTMSDLIWFESHAFQKYNTCWLLSTLESEESEKFEKVAACHELERLTELTTHGSCRSINLEKNVSETKMVLLTRFWNCNRINEDLRAFWVNRILYYKMFGPQNAWV